MEAKEKYAERFMGVTPTIYGKLEDRQRKVIKIFTSFHFGRILDLGCGDGNFSLLLKKACEASEVYGVEITEQGVMLAKSNNVKAYRVNIDVDTLPFEDGFFDAVYAGEVIEHLYDADHFLREIHRVLKPNGVFVLSTPNLASLHNRVALLLGYQPFSVPVSLDNMAGFMITGAAGAAPDHIRHFTLRALRDLLDINNLKVVGVMGAQAMLSGGNSTSKIADLIDRLITFAPSISYRVIMTCRKLTA